MIKLQVDQLLKQLEMFRETHGEESYQSARRQIALAILNKPNGEEFVRQHFGDLNIQELRAEAARTPDEVAKAFDEGGKQYDSDQMEHPTAGAAPMTSMVDLLRQQMPSVKSQAQFNSFMACFDALRLTLDAYFRGDTKAADEARGALNTGLDMAAQMREVAAKVQEIPKEQRSANAQAHIDPPAEYTEGSSGIELLGELQQVSSLQQLNSWYTARKPVLDRIVSQDLRNQIFDAIRKKRNGFQAQEAN